MTRRPRSWTPLAICLLVLLALPAFAAADEQKLFTRDFLPAQPDLALTDEFTTNLFTGSFLYTYRLQLPPGTNGLQPMISLVYASQRTSSPPTVLGTGWDLTQSYVQRNVNATPTATADDAFTLVLDGTSHDLVYVADDASYHTNPEAFLHVSLQATTANEKGTYWVVKQPDGTSYRFGHDLDAEVPSDHGSFTWRWYLDLVNDTYNNSLFYAYRESPFAEDYNATYLWNVTYNNDRSRFVAFSYESAARADLWTLYDQGNKVRQSRVLQQVATYANGSLVRSYALGYVPVATRRLLANITLGGADNATLPPTSFAYENATPNWGANSSWLAPMDFASSLSADNGTRLVDVNRDGLTDILYSKEISGDCTESREAYVNTGTGWVRNTTWDPPLCFIENVQSRDRGVRLADVNGDGLIDMIRGQQSGGCINDAYLNTGSGWVQDNTWAPPICFVEPFGEDRGVRLVDVNGDGLPDLIRARAADITNKCDQDAFRDARINTGSGWVQDATWFPPLTLCFAQYQGQGTGAELADVNGDGLVDIIQANATGSFQCLPENKRVWINNGSGWVRDDTWIPPTCFADPNGVSNGTRFADINGDGLVDLLYGADLPGGCRREAWLNNGSGWISPLDPWTPPYCFVDQVGSDRGARIADVTGDGLPDHLKSQQTVTKESATNNGSRPFLLRSINSSYGGRLEVEYKRSTLLDNNGNDSVPDLPFNAWVVSSVAQSNGLGGSQNVTATTRYAYEDGFYDSRTQDFRGFALANETRPDGSTVLHRFHQDQARKGREFSTEVFNATGVLLERRGREWNATENRSYFIVELREENVSSFDGQLTGRTAKTTYRYDPFGNVVEKISYGDVATAGDERHERTSYAANVTAWIVDRPSTRLLLAADNLTIVRASNFSYDGLPTGEQPIRGSLTRREDHLNAGQNAITAFGYDTRGNRINQTDPNNRTTRFSYGPATAFTFPDNETNALGHVTRTAWNLGLGQLTSLTDPNGFVTTWTYDTFGRLANETRPYDSAAAPTIQYQYDVDGVAPERITVLRRESAGGGTFDTVQFFDGFGKLALSKAESESGAQIRTDSFYDPNVRLAQQSVPYENASTEGYTLPNETVNRTVFAYDALDRLTGTRNPDGTLRNLSYRQWNTTITDENGNRIVQARDAHGQVVEVEEHVGGEVYRTQYAYNAAGELTNITDSEARTFRFTYDTLGRRTSMDDPDLGAWSYQYDPAGNLIAQTDARGVRVDTSYDALNRPARRNASAEVVQWTYDRPLNGTLSSVQTANLTANYTRDNRTRVIAERLLVAGNDSTLNYTFDSLDRLTQLRLPDGGTITSTWSAQNTLEALLPVVTAMDHNELGQPELRAYANGLTSTFDYQPENLRLRRIRTGGLQDLNFSYDNASNVLRIEDLANAFNLSLAYDALHRLVEANRTDAGDTQANLSLAYAYTSTGNLLSVTSNGNNTFVVYVYNASSPAHAPQRTVQTGPLLAVENLRLLGVNGSTKIYGFDLRNNQPSNLTGIAWTLATGEGLIRSEVATTLVPNETLWAIVAVTYVNASTNYTVAASAAAAGFWDAEASTSFDPDPNLTHTFAYDANGNLIQDADFVYEYNRFNQLVRVRAGGPAGAVVEEYAYDPDGNRVIKDSPAETTLYFTRHFLTTVNASGQFNTTYYWDGVTLLARKDPNGAFFYYHPDHLGSTTLITNGSGAVVDDTSYAPFGQPLFQSTSRFLYTGKEHDRSTGLQYYGARYYSPALGRFTQPDQLLPGPYNPQALNRFAYTLNNPLKYTDLDGNTPTLITAAIGAGIGAAVGAGFEIYSQYTQYGEIRDWNAVGTQSLGGAVAGGVAGLTLGIGTAVLGTSGLSSAVIFGGIGGALGGQAERATLNVVEGRGIGTDLGDAGDIGRDTLTTGLVGIDPTEELATTWISEYVERQAHGHGFEYAMNYLTSTYSSTTINSLITISITHSLEGVYIEDEVPTDYILFLLGKEPEPTASSEE